MSARLACHVWLRSPSLRTFLRVFWGVPCPPPMQQLPPVSRIPMLWAPTLGCDVQGRFVGGKHGTIQTWPDAGNNPPTPSRTFRRMSGAPTFRTSGVHGQRSSKASAATAAWGVLFSTCLRDGLLLLVLLVPLSAFLNRGRYAAYDPTLHGLQYHERERLTEQNIEPVRLQCYTATLKSGLATQTSY